MTFTRRVEDFTCEHCGTSVKGNGYTNHCLHCLWSKHVDIDPGDRRAMCLGMMEPIRIEGASPAYVIVHRCVRCGHERKNKVGDEDDADAVLAIVQANAAS